MPKYKKLTDFHLWKRFKAGDKLALDVIFKRHYPLLHNYGKKLTKDTALTEDCLQDFFLYIYEHRQNLKDLDAIRPEFSIEEIMIEQENTQFQNKQILHILHQLTNKQRELIYLKYYNNLTIKEIAEVVGISYQGVLNGLSKTMKKLKKVLVSTLVFAFSIIF